MLFKLERKKKKEKSSWHHFVLELYSIIKLQFNISFLWHHFQFLWYVLTLGCPGICVISWITYHVSIIGTLIVRLITLAFNVTGVWLKHKTTCHSVWNTTFSGIRQIPFYADLIRFNILFYQQKPMPQELCNLIMKISFRFSYKVTSCI